MRALRGGVPAGRRRRLSAQRARRVRLWLTFRVKHDLYVLAEAAVPHTRRQRRRVARATPMRGPARWVLAQLSGVGERAAGDEDVRLPGAAHAAGPARALALSPVALPPRSALAGARSRARPLVRDRARALDGGTAGASPAAPRRLRDAAGPTRRVPTGTPRGQAGAGGVPGSHPPSLRSRRSRRSAASRSRAADRGPCPARSASSNP